jgi:biotin synthase
LGSALVIGLLEGKLDAAPTTAYLLTYKDGKCAANCSFCPQARGSHGRADMLSRVSWPDFPTESVVDGLEKSVKEGRIKRVCVQALNYPKVFAHLTALSRTINRRTHVRISVSCQPVDKKNIRLLAEAKTERIGIPLDAATRGLFDKVKGFSARGPYRWKRQFELLDEAVDVFGRGKVSTHLIVGLGETEKDMIEIIQRCTDIGVLPALFAFTPIAGTILENEPQPPIQKYRRIQIARHLIVYRIARYDAMQFDGRGNISDFGVEEQTVSKIIQRGEPFITSGCPDCNRPYYNEKPSGPLYNYPKELTDEEISQVRKQLGLDGA